MLLIHWNEGVLTTLLFLIKYSQPEVKNTLVLPDKPENRPPPSSINIAKMAEELTNENPSAKILSANQQNHVR